MLFLVKEAKRRKVIAKKQQNNFNLAQSSSSYLFHVDVQKTGVKKVKVNAFKCVSFVLFDTLRNSSDT